MGRKKVMFDAKKTQVSISLSNLDVQRIDSITTQRSRWIRRAIQDKFLATEGVLSIDSRKMIAILHARHRDNLDVAELLERILQKLPESGE